MSVSVLTPDSNKWLLPLNLSIVLVIVHRRVLFLYLVWEDAQVLVRGFVTPLPVFMPFPSFGDPSLP